MRVLGAIITALACLILGLGYGSVRRERIKTLSQLCSGLEIMRGELEGRLSPMPELCALLRDKCRGSAAAFFDDLCLSLPRLGEESFSRLWSLSCESCLYTLGRDELYEFSSLGNILGSFCLKEQLEAIGSLLDFLRLRLNEARSALPAEQRLGLGVGAAAGAMLVLGLI